MSRLQLEPLPIPHGPGRQRGGGCLQLGGGRQRGEGGCLQPGRRLLRLRPGLRVRGGGWGAVRRKYGPHPIYPNMSSSRRLSEGSVISRQDQDEEQLIIILKSAAATKDMPRKRASYCGSNLHEYFLYICFLFHFIPIYEFYVLYYNKMVFVYLLFLFVVTTPTPTVTCEFN